MNKLKIIKAILFGYGSYLLYPLGVQYQELWQHLSLVFGLIAVVELIEAFRKEK